MIADFDVHWSPSEPVRDFHRVQVWFCDLDADWQLDFPGRSPLSVSELARAERLKSLLERRRFVARCVFVRRVLGNFVGVAPAALQFRDGTHGKPRLAFPVGANDWYLAALDFNLSHTEDVLALAVASGRDVGIDVEVVKPGVDVLAVGEAQFAAEESAWLRALPLSEGTLAFYRLWTRKEALAKADGRGIAFRPAVETRADSRWQVHSFEFTFGEKEIYGALALEADAHRLPVSVLKRAPRIAQQSEVRA